MSDYPTLNLLIESIDEEAGGPLTSEGVDLVRKGWERGQEALQSELTAARDEAERLRGRVGELEKCVDDGSDAWLLRKQAEAIEAVAEQFRESGGPGKALARIKLNVRALELRQQADELEKSGGTHD